MNKKQNIINKVKNFENKYFNEDQKDIAIDILKRCPDEQIQECADFIFMKRRTGFAFDYSPEIAKGKIITIKEDKSRRINVNNKIEKDENKLIIGDNYNALKSLLVAHKNKINIIYIDPPYNTEAAKNDGNQSSKEGQASSFIYKDKFGRGGWLNMMKSRLTLAKDLLADDGVIFVSIDDREQAYLKVLMDEIFGEDNTDTIIWKKIIPGLSGGGIMKTTKTFRKDHEYIHVGFINKKNTFFKNFLELPNFKNKYKNPDNDPRGPYKAGGISQNTNMKLNQNSSKYYTVVSPLTGKKFSRVWRVSEDEMQSLIKDNRIYFGKDGNSIPARKIFINEPRLTTPSSLLENLSSTGEANHVLNSIIGESDFNTTKPIELIMRILKISSNKNSTILDFFAGSGTTGHAVMELNKQDDGNRKFILVTNNENNIALNITYKRLYRIILGKGTKGETNFDWLEKNEPYSSEKLRVINVDDSVKISLDENISEEVYENCLNGLNLLDGKYNKKNLNLYYDLAALNPLENDDDKF